MTTGSIYWPAIESGKAVDGWGIAGAKYGEFTCGTCHGRATGNIKRVKTSLVAPDAADLFPIQAAGGTVNFQSTSGPNSFGDDGRAPLTSSTLICESCHSKTAVHRYDSSGIADFNHKNANRTDCMTCHPHRQGFTPLGCDSCHGNPPTTVAGLVTGADATGSTTAGAHQMHAVTLGYACNHCHDGYVMPNNGDIDIHFANFGSLTGTYSGQAGISYNGVAGTGGLTCNTVYCHSTGQSADGASATPSAYSTPAWNGTAACGSCHNATDPGTGSHTAHIADGATCATCHAGNTHVNRQIEVTTGSYSAAGAPGNGYGTCSTASCHNDGRNGGQTGTWGTTINNCAECHATVPTTGSHTDHVALFTCGTCHTGAVQGTTAPATGHRDGNIDTDAATGLPADKALGSAFTSCGTSNCHGSGSPVWGTDLDSYDPCTQCHGQLVAAPATDAQKAPGGLGVDTNGDSAATDAQVGAHQIHLNPTMSKPVACGACHSVPATITAAGHIDTALPAELSFSGLALGGLDGQAAVAPANSQAGCATVYCHNGAAIKNGWGGGTLAPTWTDTSFVQGTAADCDNCHGYPPTPANGHPSNTDCSVCHDVLNADDVTFTAAGKLTHVDGIVQASGGDTCTDCHNADIDGALNGAHARHTDVATFLAGKTISGGGYGGAGWYATTYTGGQPMFGCGQCHPANEGVNHPTAGLNVDIDPAGETPPAGNVKTKNAAQSTPTFASRSSVTCASVYCHSDGMATPAYQTTPDWYGGTVSGNCTDCHGNAPATGTHAAHAVGIHYDGLYGGGAGLMATGGGSGSGAAHGDAATSDPIGCQTCHFNTVEVRYNAANSVCSGCHSDTNLPATGNERAIIKTTGTVHVNGVKDVVFADLSTFKSKAQLRDDITTVSDLNSNWTRTNGYKTPGSFDQGKGAAPTYSAGTCASVSCHNGITTPAWSGGFTGNCRSCHASLPQ